MLLLRLENKPRRTCCGPADDRPPLRYFPTRIFRTSLLAKGRVLHASWQFPEPGYWQSDRVRCALSALPAARKVQTRQSGAPKKQARLDSLTSSVHRYAMEGRGRARVWQGSIHSMEKEQQPHSL